MKKVLCLAWLLIAGGTAIAQTDVEMGDNFSLSGKSITFFKTENANGAKPSAKIWHLEGISSDSCKKVRFWLSDPKTNENTDSIEWNGDIKVLMRITDKGDKAYIVHDNDSTYLNIINIQGDVSGVQLFSSLINKTTTRLPSSQIEVLESVRLEADPMLSRNVGRTELRSKHVVIEIHDDGTIKWWLRNPPHIFVGDRWALTGDRMPTCKAKVAVYKEDGTLLAMAEKWKGYPSEHGTIMNMYAKSKIINHRNEKLEPTIFDILVGTKQYHGSYIRVVTPVYGDYLMDFSFRIPDSMYINR